MDEWSRGPSFRAGTPVSFSSDPDGELSVLGVRGSGSTSSHAVTSSRFLLQSGTMSLPLNTSTALLSRCGSRRLSDDHGYGGRWVARAWREREDDDVREIPPSELLSTLPDRCIGCWIKFLRSGRPEEISRRASLPESAL